MKRNIIEKLSPLVVLACLAVPTVGQVTSVDQIRFPALPPFQVSEPKRVELENGMVVILIEDHELPLISVVARIRTGSRLEASERVGLASLTGSVLRSGGTQAMSGDELDDYLEGRAANVSSSIGGGSGSASMDCLKEDFRPVLSVFADILRRPAFQEDKLAIAKNQAVAGISRQNDNPQQILFREFREVVYGSDSPYARNETYQTIESITRDDLLAWHAQYFHPNNIIMGVIGDFETTEALAAIRESFGDWASGPKAEPPTAAYQERFEPGVYYVEKNDMTQSNIVIGHLGIRRDNPDYFAVEILNEILSGGGASRLYSNVRTTKGLAYAVSGGVSANWDYPGTFSMFMTTKTETTGAGIEALLEEAENLTAKPPTQEEVDKAKTGILNSFIFNVDTRSKILGQQLTYEYYGYPLDWLTRYRRGIEATTVEQVRQAAAKYVMPDRFGILVVGPSEGRDQPLTKFGNVVELDITIPEPDKPEVAVTAEGTEKATEVIGKALQAAGGASAVDAISSLRFERTSTLTAPQGEIPVKSSVLVVPPGRMRQVLTLPFGEILTVLSPDDAFMKTPQGLNAIPGSQRGDLVKGMRRDPLLVLQARNDDDFSAVWAGDSEVDGKPVHSVRIEVGGGTFTAAFDSKTFLVVQIQYRGSGLGRGPGAIVQNLSDFREVSGVQYPFQTVTTHEGQPMVSTTVDSLVVNEPFDETSFKRPESQQ